MEKINIANIILTSVNDGPGIRTVLFLQGCSRKCIGCHNSNISDFNGGVKYNIKEIVALLNSCCFNKRITISGGEPLEQYDSVLTLVKELIKEEYDICIYTGNELNEVPSEIFQYINYIKVGRYIQEYRDVSLAFVGSSNQKLYKIEKEGDKYWKREI